MKTTSAVVMIMVALLSRQLAAQIATSTKNLTQEAAKQEPYSIVERGANQRVWQRVVAETNLLGRISYRTNSYTELETGMHYLENGQWKETKAEIELLTDGAAATKGPHKVVFAANINTAGAIDLTTPDGKPMRSHVLGLSYFDRATGESVLIAEVKDSIGLLVDDNQIIYTNAFTDIKADIRYTYTKAGFEQDIILRDELPSPAEWKLDPATTRLQVLTEFLTSPPLEKLAMGSTSTNASGRENLNFGVLRIGRGKAFSIGPAAESGKAVPVNKQWLKLEGRQFLIEELDYGTIERELRALPKRTAAIRPGRTSAGKTVIEALGAHLPKKMAKLGTDTIRLAKLEMAKQPGFVLDYQTLSSTSDYTLRADTTYYVTNTVYLDGTPTIEGGTVVKFSTNSAASIVLSGAIRCDTGPYRPAIFTGKDDDSVGETISGSTGTPTGYYGGSALVIPESAVLQNLRFSYLRTGVEGPGTYTQVLGDGVGNAYLHDVQFVRCQYPVKLDGNTSYVGNTFYVRNGLFWETGTNFYGSGFVHVEHLTVHNSGALFHDPNGNVGSLISLTNCLLVSLTNLGSYYTVTSNSTIRLTSDSGIFQTVGAGSHYLAANSPYRNAGTTNINSGMLAELKRVTTYPPLVSTRELISSDRVLAPQAQRDTDTPDLGYHYDPLDYAFGGTRITNASITVLPGTAIGMFDAGTTYGLALQHDSQFHSEGTPTAPNWITRYNMVQEQSNNTWTNVYYGYSIVGDWLGGPAPIIHCRFTKWSATGATMHFADINQSILLWFTDCEFYAGGFRIVASSANLTNCLFHRTYTIISDSTSATDANVRNCLFIGNTLLIEHFDSGNFVFRDNAFDQVSFYQDGDVDNDFNGYPTGATRLSPNGSNDVVVASFSWLRGALGNFYQPTNSALVNIGSCNADTVGLYHYTTDADQEKEAASLVDIGLHYVAVTSSVPATIWVEDDIPAGATEYTDSDSWNWISSDPAPYSGSVSHQSDPVDWFHQHLFAGATETLTLAGEDTLFCYMYLIATNLPSEAMLQWEANDVTWWNHRATWGPDDLQWPPRNYVSPLPAAGAWLRLEIPPRSVGLEGATLVSMAYTLSSGTAVWDYAGKVGRRVPIDTDGDGAPDYGEDTNGNGAVDSGETDWNSATDLGLRVFITEPKRSANLP